MSKSNPARISGLALAIAAAGGAAAQAQTIDLLTTSGNFLSIEQNAPGTVTSTRTVTGLAAGDRLLGIDYRPERGTNGSGLSFSNSVFAYGIGASGQLYRINRNTGVATSIGSLNAGLPLTGTAFGVDFNPVPDRLRVNSNAEENLRIAVDGVAPVAIGTTVVDGALNVGGVVQPASSIVGAAYTNNVEGATTTTLYVIDSGTDRLLVQNPPNSGGLDSSQGGPLGVNTSENVGFDILTVGSSNIAVASLTDPATGRSSLYTINLATGAATLIGAIGTTAPVDGLAFNTRPAQLASGNAAERAVAQALFGYAGTPNSADFTSFLSTAGQVELGAGASLGGEIYLELPTLSIAQSRATVDAVASRLADRDAGSFWMAVIGGGAEADGARGLRDYEYDHVGVILGGDAVVGGLTVGGAFQLGDGSLSLKSSGDDADLTTYGFVAYARYAFGGLALDGVLGFNSDNYDVRRTGGAAAKVDGNRYTAGLRGSYAFNLGGFSLVPAAGLTYVRFDADRARETGAVPLVADIGEVDSVTSDIGFEVSRSFAIGDGQAIAPYIGVAWQHEFAGERDYAAGFAQIPNAGRIRLADDAPNENALLVRAGFDTVLSAKWSVYGGYRGEYGDRITGHDVQGGVRYRW
ncbi:DUF4394 domain-containing protein [Zavarzinia compransoris]|uniref:Autotransporter domain-containing protein n=1 Tax=Zavarzinia compransoris TaxID=1264899 RepID=A0A317DTF0_9PROT|nr:DUF4394 domain-containing protein [Zavarzinia compransoris]PWR17967.1 hypothetical protein DKG75_20720 [Zavarzinia compransoris]TDP40376.1 outer membrane autotransporter protein [Zavarzinia compransoris]